MTWVNASPAVAGFTDGFVCVDVGSGRCVLGYLFVDGGQKILVANETRKPAAWTAASGVNIVNTADTLVPFDTEEEDPDSAYPAPSPAGEIVLPDTDVYHVNYGIPVNDDSTAGATRAAIRAWTTINGVIVPQSYAQDYHREAGQGSGVAHGFVASANAGEILRVFVRTTANSDVSAETAEASLSIHKVPQRGSVAHDLSTWWQGGYSYWDITP